MSSINNVGVYGVYFNETLINKNDNNEKIEFNGIDYVEILMDGFEKGLDYAGLSCVSGIVRCPYGVIQLITALAFKMIGMVGSNFEALVDSMSPSLTSETVENDSSLGISGVEKNDSFEEPDDSSLLEVVKPKGTSVNEKKNYWEKFINRADYHIDRGIGNIERGLTEIIPGGNLAWWFMQTRHRESMVIDSDMPPTGCFWFKVKHKNENIYFNRYFYEGELKWMHHAIQTVANKRKEEPCF